MCFIKLDWIHLGLHFFCSQEVSGFGDASKAQMIEEFDRSREGLQKKHINFDL